MKILFYARRNLHIPHLDPIREWFASNRPDIEIAYSSPPYIPAFPGQPGIGLTKQMLAEIKNGGTAWIPEHSLQGWAPNVTIVADADFGGIRWGGRIANVNHGLICKGTFYTTAPLVQRENGADLICVPGPYHERILKQNVRRAIFATGLVKFDPVGKGILTQAVAKKKYNIPVDHKVILLAPTYNLELSAVPVIVDSIRELVNETTWVLIKLHGMSPEPWIELYKLLSKVEEHIVYENGQNLLPPLVASDAVISDVSSAYMEAISLDKPVVLVNNPLQKSFPMYDPNDIEYAWRHVGEEVETVEELHESVHYALNHPENKRELRKKYGPELVGPIDGKAAERASIAIIALAES